MGARSLLVGYLGLSVGCILLTGSRSSLLGLVVWGAMRDLPESASLAGASRPRSSAPLLFLALPDSLQTRFETIVNPEVGPANARASGEGRLEGLIKGMELIGTYPATGIGPGLVAAGDGEQAGVAQPVRPGLRRDGATGRSGVRGDRLPASSSNIRWMRRAARRDPPGPMRSSITWPAAVAMSVFLLLFEGNFGHNLFRHNWLWFGGFLDHRPTRGSSAWRSGHRPGRKDVAARVMSWRVRRPGPAGVTVGPCPRRRGLQTAHALLRGVVMRRSAAAALLLVALPAWPTTRSGPTSSGSSPRT